MYSGKHYCKQGLIGGSQKIIIIKKKGVERERERRTEEWRREERIMVK